MRNDIIIQIHSLSHPHTQKGGHLYDGHIFTWKSLLFKCHTHLAITLYAIDVDYSRDAISEVSLSMIIIVNEAIYHPSSRQRHQHHPYVMLYVVWDQALYIYLQIIIIINVIVNMIRLLSLLQMNNMWHEWVNRENIQQWLWLSHASKWVETEWAGINWMRSDENWCFN